MDERIRQPDTSDGVLKCPPWGPEGNKPFRIWVRELYPWLNLTAGRYSPSNQAAAIQRGVTGAAYRLLIRVPPQYIQNGAVINGVQTDPITYLLYLMGNRWENTEDERITTDGTAIFDFQVNPRDGIDSILLDWDVARETAERVGAGLNNFHLLSMILFRKMGLRVETLQEILRDLDGHMPTNQRDYERVLMRLRRYARLKEGFPGNLHDALHGRGGRTFLTHEENASTAFLGQGESEAHRPSFLELEWAGGGHPAPVEMFHAHTDGMSGAHGQYSTRGAPHGLENWNSQIFMQNQAPSASSPDGSLWDQSDWTGEDTYDELFSNTDTDTVSSIGNEDPHQLTKLCLCLCSKTAHHMYLPQSTRTGPMLILQVKMPEAVDFA